MSLGVVHSCSFFVKRRVFGVHVCVCLPYLIKKVFEHRTLFLLANIYNTHITTPLTGPRIGKGNKQKETNPIY